jgi:hypothetical protein
MLAAVNDFLVWTVWIFQQVEALGIKNLTELEAKT